MRKREQEELRRLEEALMEPEFDRMPADEMDILEESWQIVSDVQYDSYNTDNADVDLDAYSQDVLWGRQSNALVTVLTLLPLAALFAALVWLLKYLGVL